MSKRNANYDLYVCTYVGHFLFPRKKEITWLSENIWKLCFPFSQVHAKIKNINTNLVMLWYGININGIYFVNHKNTCG